MDQVISITALTMASPAQGRLLLEESSVLRPETEQRRCFELRVGRDCLE